MRFLRVRLITWAGLGLLAAFLAGPAGVAGAAGPLTVFVTVAPQATFVRAIGGKHVQVYVMVPAGASHETYEPTPRQIQELSQADLYFRVGMPFEDAWMNKIQANNPKMKIIDTRQGIVLLGLSDPVEGGRSSKDPHIWMDPNLVKIQARTIASALTSGDPAHQAEYTQNLLAFEAQLTQLDRNLRTILSQVKNPRFMVFHPAWGYFAQAYGLTQISVENEGKEPGPRSLEAIIQTAKQQGIKTVFVQKPFNTRSANMIAQAIHGHVVPMDPMSPDYFANLIAMAKLIAEG